MALIRNFEGDDPRLAPFASMTDSELRDPHQLIGLARALQGRGVAPSVRRAGEDSLAGPSHSSHPSENTAAFDGRWLEAGLFVGESRLVIERALAAGLAPFSVLVDEGWLAHEQPLIDRLLDADEALPVFVADQETFRTLTGFQRTRGALAAFLRPPSADPAALLESARAVVLLEDVTNATNIGAIFRSAAALGADAVLVTPRCHDPFYRRAARVSMGTVFQVPWTRVPSAAEGLALLQACGFSCVAFALDDDAVTLPDPRLAQLSKAAVVVGTEGAGLDPATTAACDWKVRIPMAHEVDSLNVAAASAVAFWELWGRHRLG